MKSMKVIAFLAFLLNTILFATYYAVAKEALGRIDPIMFTFFEIATLTPAACCILALTWNTIRWPILKHGFLLGSSLSLALFTIAIALKYTTATGTAFFPALNGFLAALIAWIFLRQPVSKATWCAGLLSTIGVTLLILNSPMGGIRGVLIAFLGGLFFTGYVFLSDNHIQDAQPHQNSKAITATKRHRHYHTTSDPQAEWALFGVELFTMALWGCLIALLFGDWEAVHMSLPKDGLVILYVAGACTFLPTLLTVLLQKHTSPVTVSFIYILEPVFSAIIAMLYLHEMLPLFGYIGGILVVAGAIIHTSGPLWQKQFSLAPVGAGVAAAAGWGPSGSPTAHNTASRSRRGGGAMVAGWGPSGSLAAHNIASLSTSSEPKLLGLRLASSAPAPTYSVTEPLPRTHGNIAAYAHTTFQSPRRGDIYDAPATPVLQSRVIYSIGAVEWVDDDICERPTRPVLSPQLSHTTRDLSVWLEENITNQPTQVQPVVQKPRVRTTEDLREFTLPTRTGKGPIWQEEDASAASTNSVGTSFSASTARFIERDSHLNTTAKRELA